MNGANACGSLEGKPIGFLRLKTMCNLLGLSKSTIWDLSRNDPEFPKPVKISHSCTGWKACEVYDWIESRERVALYGGTNE